MFNPASKIGKVVNNLWLDSILGMGSFACCYIGESVRTKRKYAVKCVFKYGLTEDQLQLQRQEIVINQKLAANPHPNIVAWDRSFETDDSLYLVFELVGNGSNSDLYSAINKQRGFSDEDTIRYMLQLLDAVEYCHKKGVYHRDLKPENILVAKNDQLKVCDFGLATCDEYSSVFGVGSVPYMSPEVYDESNTGEYECCKVDIWSLGIIMFNLRLGKNPWNAPTDSDELYQDWLEDPYLFQKHFPVTKHFIAILMRALDPDPSMRCTIDEFRTLLQNASSPLLTEEGVDGRVTMAYMDGYCEDYSSAEESDHSRTFLNDSLSSSEHVSSSGWGDWDDDDEIDFSVPVFTNDDLEDLVATQMQGLRIDMTPASPSTHSTSDTATQSAYDYTDGLTGGAAEFGRKLLLSSRSFIKEAGQKMSLSPSWSMHSLPGIQSLS